MLNLLSRLMLTIPEEDVMYGYYDPMPVDEAQILGIVVLVWLGLLLFSLANYILFSLGLYNVAKNNNVSAPGLAWVPVARQWVKGSIVDFHSKKRGYDSKWRILLPIFACLPFLVFIAMYVVIIGTVLAAADALSPPDLYMTEELSAMIITFVIAYIALLVAELLNIISNIIVDYKIYEEIVPKKAIIYTFLSYFIPLAKGICLLTCKKYGNGIKQEPIAFAPQGQNNFGFDYQPQPQQPQFYQPQSQQPQFYQPQPQQPQFYQPQPETVDPLQTLEYLVEDDVAQTVGEVMEAAPIEEIAPTEDIDDSDIFTE
ncbi:MAG: hypothetical protein J6Q89_06895 [Clostridia bacterium]|nr:hypothetical protein [Clostridia bacterium]